MGSTPAAAVSPVKTAPLAQNFALNQWIDDLGSHENCPAEGIIDSNGLRSYGRFCFQAATFKRYVRQYDLFPRTENAELMNLISDYDIQRYLVGRIIQEPGGWYNWFNTVKKIGKPPVSALFCTLHDYKKAEI